MIEKKRMPASLILALAALATLALISGCSDDDDPMTPAPVPETFTLTIENVSMAQDVAVAGVFDTPVGQKAPGPIFPGDAYQFTFGANPGDKLSFATMFVQSNDLFYAPEGTGIALFDGDTPVSGDVTAQVYLWDGGTEMNEEPGVGANQAPRQSGPDVGVQDADMTVRMVDDMYNYPSVSEVIQVTITPLGENLFRARLENVSDANTLMTSQGSVAVPMAPGVFAVHSGADPLFTDGAPDMKGLEGLAEDGNPGALADNLMMMSGYPVPLAPGVAVVHTDQAMVYADGAPNGGLGLEALAEDGDPSGLAGSLDGAAGVASVTVFNTPAGAGGPAPIFPGDRYVVTFTAEPGDRLSLATMFVHSNDLFYGFDDAGLALFDALGDPVTGDVTGSLYLWDAGTEMNQWPAVGPDQAPRQGGANTGAADADADVRMVDDGFIYPLTGDVIKVTLTTSN
jgi:hypothetical protein